MTVPKFILAFLGSLGETGGPGKPAKITFGENKNVNSWNKFRLLYYNSFCASLGRSLCHGNEHHGIDPNILSSGHHDCSTKAVFLCTAVKLQPCHMLARHGTYWRMLVCSLLHISFIGTIASVVLSSSCYEVLSFETSPWAGFGQILDVACATTEKH